KGSVVLGPHGLGIGGRFEANGGVNFRVAKIGRVIFVQDATFAGGPADLHGFSASGMSTGALIWGNVNLQNGAILDLEGATMVALLDMEDSWPPPGKLLIDGFTYDRFGGPAYPSPRDARSRLKWLSLQPRYYPQPYQQLAKVLRSSGDEVGALKVLIAGSDARYAQYGPAGRAMGWMLRVTIGY